MVLTGEQYDVATKILETFFPYAAKRRKEMGGVGRFVHYTSAANALSIIKSQRMWMRNATCMSYYQEVQHGYNLLNRYFAHPSNKQAFVEALSACSDGAADEAFTAFNQWWQNTQLETFITSISEHLISEDLHGRLSMWRAFAPGTSARVALVVNIPLRVGLSHDVPSLV
jgi:hypothetical protein